VVELNELLMIEEKQIRLSELYLSVLQLVVVQFSELENQLLFRRLISFLYWKEDPLK
jgi:hypothetical protein